MSDGFVPRLRVENIDPGLDLVSSSESESSSTTLLRFVTEVVDDGVDGGAVIGEDVESLFIDGRELVVRFVESAAPAIGRQTGLVGEFCMLGLS